MNGRPYDQDAEPELPEPAPEPDEEPAHGPEIEPWR